MKRIIATSLVALVAGGLYLGMPSESKASGISLTIDIGRPYRPVAPVFVPAPVVVAPRPVVFGGSYYGPAPLPYSPYASYATVAGYPGPGCNQVIVRPVVIAPPVFVHPAHHQRGW